eukprot:4308842-Amphidinium_carterae.1
MPVGDGVAAVLFLRADSDLEKWSLQSEISTEAWKLCPWELRLIHVVRVPKAKRWHTDHPDTHRLNFVKYSDGTYDLDQEYLGTAMMRQRFRKPLDLPPFLYGNARDDPADPPPPPPVVAPRGLRAQPRNSNEDI